MIPPVPEQMGTYVKMHLRVHAKNFIGEAVSTAYLAERFALHDGDRLGRARRVKLFGGG
jgi:hypothetical protein